MKSREEGGTNYSYILPHFILPHPWTRVPLQRWGKRKEGKPPPFAPLLINIRVYPPTFAANTVIDEFAARLFAQENCGTSLNFSFQRLDLGANLFSRGFCNDSSTL